MLHLAILNNMIKLYLKLKYLKTIFVIMSPIIIECYLGTKAIRCSIMYYAHLASMKLERFTFHGSFLIMYVYVISVYNKSFAYVSQLIIIMLIWAVSSTICRSYKILVLMWPVCFFNDVCFILEFYTHN